MQRFFPLIRGWISGGLGPRHLKGGGELLRLEALDQFRTAEGVAPDLHFRGCWCFKTEDFNWKHHPLQEELIGSNAAQDHDPIAAVLVTTLELIQSFEAFESTFTPLSWMGCVVDETFDAFGGSSFDSLWIVRVVCC